MVAHWDLTFLLGNFLWREAPSPLININFPPERSAEKSYSVAKVAPWPSKKKNALERQFFSFALSAENPVEYWKLLLHPVKKPLLLNKISVGALHRKILLYAKSGLGTSKKVCSARINFYVVAKR